MPVSVVFMTSFIEGEIEQRRVYTALHAMRASQVQDIHVSVGPRDSWAIHGVLVFESVAALYHVNPRSLADNLLLRGVAPGLQLVLFSADNDPNPRRWEWDGKSLTVRASGTTLAAEHTPDVHVLVGDELKAFVKRTGAGPTAMQLTAAMQALLQQQHPEVEAELGRAVGLFGPMLTLNAPEFALK